MPCVYTTSEKLCDSKAALSQNEHYLPRALGNFQNDERLVDRICNNCQKVCSQLEDVFAHNSPEAFFREMVGRVGRKKITKGKTFSTSRHSASRRWRSWESIRGTISRFFGNWFLIRRAPEIAGAPPISQLVFISKDGKTLRLPFRRGTWTVEIIREILKQSGVTGSRSWWSGIVTRNMRR